MGEANPSPPLWFFRLSPQFSHDQNTSPLTETLATQATEVPNEKNFNIDLSLLATIN